MLSTKTMKSVKSGHSELRTETVAKSQGSTLQLCAGSFPCGHHLLAVLSLHLSGLVQRQDGGMVQPHVLEVDVWGSELSLLCGAEGRSQIRCSTHELSTWEDQREQAERLYTILTSALARQSSWL